MAGWTGSPIYPAKANHELRQLSTNFAGRKFAAWIVPEPQFSAWPDSPWLSYWSSPVEPAKPGKENAHSFANSHTGKEHLACCWEMVKEYGWQQCSERRNCYGWYFCSIRFSKYLLTAYHKLTSEKLTCSLQSHSFIHSFTQQIFTELQQESLETSMQVSFRNSRSFLRPTLRHAV